MKRWALDTPPDIQTIESPEAGVAVLAPDPNSTWLVTGSIDEAVRVWDLDRGKELATLIGHRHERNRADITGLAVVGSEPYILSSSRDMTIRVWNARTFKEVRVLRGHESDIEGLAATKDGRLLASTGGYDKRLILWNLHDGHELERIEGDSWWAGGVAFSPNGEFVAYGGNDATINIHSSVSRALAAKLAKQLYSWVRSIAYSPDGELLAATDGNTVNVWKTQAGTIYWRADTGEFVTKVAFSPDGSRVLTVDKDSVRLWDRQNGTQVWSYQRPGANISDACFTPDGRRLVVGCRTKPSILIFDAGADWQKQLAGKESGRLQWGLPVKGCCARVSRHRTD